MALWAVFYLFVFLETGLASTEVVGVFSLVEVDFGTNWFTSTGPEILVQSEFDVNHVWKK